MSEIYDEDYFERGLETGKSFYQNYRWVPELTIPMVMSMIDYLGIKRGQTVIDLGCAKGYVVKALRWLGRESWGVDISRYAIKNVDESVRRFCFLKEHGIPLWLLPKTADFCIAKDVFEHIPKDDLPETLEWVDAHELFAVIPLGNERGYYAPANNMDKTHVTCKDKVWWTETFRKNRWSLKNFTYCVPGIKDSYYKIHPKAHGFFTLRKMI